VHTNAIIPLDIGLTEGELDFGKINGNI
jgi:hypothetical protein